MATSLVTLLPQPKETALNFIGGSVVNNPNSGTIDITTAIGIPGQRACAQLTASQSINNSSNTRLLFDTNIYDTSNIHLPNSSQFVIPPGLGGIWLAWGQAGFQANASGLRSYGIFVNGNNPAGNTGGSLLAAVTANTITFDIGGSVLILNSGDVVEFNAFQSSEGSLNVLASSFGGIIKLL